MKSMRIIFVVVVIGLSMIMVTSSHAVSISLDPINTDVMVGDWFTVNLVIAGLGHMSAPSLSVFDIDMAYDPTILSTPDVQFGDPVLGDQLDLSGFGSITAVTIGAAGSVNLFELSFDFPHDLDALQTGEFVLATLTFEALTEGTSGLTPTVVNLGDSYGDRLTIDEVLGGRVTVAQVPEPSTLLLFGTGLVGIGIFRRKFKG